MSKNIGIITIHKTLNYGGILQAYASKEHFSQFGDVSVIDYENKYVEQNFSSLRFSIRFRGLLTLGKDILRFFPKRRAIKKFERFIDENFKYSDRVNSSNIEIKMKNKFDTLISGSDQIWNPICISEEGILDSNYILAFANTYNNVKRLSYASSCGSYNLNLLDKLTMQKLLSKFDLVTVREKETANYISDNFGCDATDVVDPTLLLTESDWVRKLKLTKTPSHNRYVFSYFLKNNELSNNIVLSIKEKMGFVEHKGVTLNLSPGKYVNHHINDGGPVDFLNSIMNSDYVITDSFHGVVFSLIFKKPFLVVSHGYNLNRISNLLNKVGGLDRIIHSTAYLNNLNFPNLNKINYSALEKEILASKSIIEQQFS